MEANYFTILYWFCHTSTCIRHGCTRVPHPEPSSHLPPHTIPLGHPCAPAPSILYPASNLDWRFISYMILYMLRCHSAKSSHPLLLPRSAKDCSIHLCLFCCPTFPLSSFTFIKKLFSSSSLFAIRVVSSACLRLLIFLPAILISSLCFFQPSVSHDVLCIQIK